MDGVFMYVKEMNLTYPNGVVESIPWENGEADTSRIERFLPVLLKEGESSENVLKPGESIKGYYRAKVKPTLPE